MYLLIYVLIIISRIDVVLLSHGYWKLYAPPQRRVSRKRKDHPALHLKNCRQFLGKGIGMWCDKPGARKQTLPTPESEDRVVGARDNVQAFFSQIAHSAVRSVDTLNSCCE